MPPAVGPGKKGGLSLVGVGRSIIFVAKKMFAATKYFCRNKHNFVMTDAYFCRNKHVIVTTKHIFCHDKNMLVVTQNFCCDKHMFVMTNMTNIILSRHTHTFVQTRVCRNRYLLWQQFCRNKRTFVTAKNMFCHGKHMFKRVLSWQTHEVNMCQLQQNFCRDKNDTCGSFCQCYWAGCLTGCHAFVVAELIKG